MQGTRRLRKYKKSKLVFPRNSLEPYYSGVGSRLTPDDVIRSMHRAPCKVAVNRDPGPVTNYCRRAVLTKLAANETGPFVQSLIFSQRKLN